MYLKQFCKVFLTKTPAQHAVMQEFNILTNPCLQFAGALFLDCRQMPSGTEAGGLRQGAKIRLAQASDHAFSLYFAASSSILDA